MTMARPQQGLVEVRCPGCRGYWGSMRSGEPYRAYCRACGLKFESKAGVG